MLSEENLSVSKELDGNLCSLVNLAVEQFVNGSGKTGMVK